MTKMMKLKGWKEEEMCEKEDHKGNIDENYLYGGRERKERAQKVLTREQLNTSWWI